MIRSAHGIEIHRPAPLGNDLSAAQSNGFNFLRMENDCDYAIFETASGDYTFESR